MIRVEIGIRMGVAFGIFLCRVSGISGVPSFLIGFILLHPIDIICILSL
jgi:hypothetical protein